jgi:hypothetical protein
MGVPAVAILVSTFADDEVFAFAHVLGATVALILLVVDTASVVGFDGFLVVVVVVVVLVTVALLSGSSPCACDDNTAAKNIARMNT